MQFAEKFQANWQEGNCLIMTIPDPIQPEQPRRGFKNYSGNFLNIRLTARIWPLVAICLVNKRFADDEEVEKELLKRLRQQPKGFSAASFDALIKRWDKYINFGGGYVKTKVFSRFEYHMLMSYIHL
jgi:hypothetical protein